MRHNQVLKQRIFKEERSTEIIVQAAYISVIFPHVVYFL